ncbi:MAG: hypothetical protein LBH11_04645 [Propionibacteriaceae bacterium]|nr:hypothetical protein [Propionibacteriaceae bacterium]
MTIYLVGGAPHDDLDTMWDAFVASARNRGNRFTVALFSDGSNATDYLDDYFAPIIRRFPEADIDPVWLLKGPETTPDPAPIGGPDTSEASDTSDTPDAPDAPAQLTPSDSATVVVEPAGLIVGDGPVPEMLAALSDRFPQWARQVRRGAQYAGFGAGAAVAARYVIAGGWKFQGNQVAPEDAAAGFEEVVLLPGLGLIGLGVEPYADTRFTTTRAMAALHAADLASAMALDTKACLAIDAVTGQTKVLGGGRVCWLTRHGKQTVVRFEAAPVVPGRG